MIVPDHLGNDSQTCARLRRLPEEETPLSAKDEAKLKKLSTKREALENKLQDDDDEANGHLYDEIDKLTECIDAIHATRKQISPDEIKAKCGVVIGISPTGDPAFTCGLLRKEDERELVTERDADASTAPGIASDDSDQSPASSYSAALLESLTQHKTAAIAVELSRQPLTALAALVHSLVLSQFGLDLHLHRSETSVQTSATIPFLKPVETAPAAEALEQQRKDWMAQFPRSSTQLWEWCLTRDQDTLLRLLAFLTARTVNAVCDKGQSLQSYRLGHADALATALRIDMTKWFTPTAENFFGRVSKTQIAASMTEAGKPPMVDSPKLKKNEFAALAEKAIVGTGWLPEAVRISAAQLDEVGYSFEDETDEPAEERGDDSGDD
jgi:ParB family chromosome partitioning protein